MSKADEAREFGRLMARRVELGQITADIASLICADFAASTTNQMAAETRITIAARKALRV